MQLLVPLLGDAVEAIVKLVIFGLLIVVPLILKAIGGVAGGGAKKPVQPGRPAQPQPVRPVANKPLRDEVEAFLRRAKAKQPVKAEAIGPPKYVPAEPIAAEIIEPEVWEGTQTRGSMTARGQGPLAPKHSAEQTEALGHDISLADEHLEAHLKETFDHDLGRFEDVGDPYGKIAQGTDADVWKVETPDSPKAAQKPTLAGEIAAMFRNPQDVRKAIVLNEVLTPPQHRWE